ncbi:prepilin-type N-terminal cleavage/methylation domain-containing protein [Bacillus sp. JJ1533]|uniref:type IV pilus modification PilV family protein n=1 Tax=Bacillus sp. JJ1533 TaxID=3122959 RepID=UPI002FFDE0AA
MSQSIKNEKGVTLIELVASIAILTIILLSFMSFFIMSAKYNGVSSDKMTATNIAREVQEEFKINEEKNLALKDLILTSRTSTETFIPKSSYPQLNVTEDIQLNNDILTFIFTEQNFTVKVNVDTSSDDQVDVSLSKLNVQVLKGTTILSETFTYFEN